MLQPLICGLSLLKRLKYREQSWPASSVGAFYSPPFFHPALCNNVLLDSFCPCKVNLWSFSQSCVILLRAFLISQAPLSRHLACPWTQNKALGLASVGILLPSSWSCTLTAMITHMHAHARARDFGLAAAVCVEVTACPARYTHRLIFFLSNLARGEILSCISRKSRRRHREASRSSSWVTGPLTPKSPLFPQAPFCTRGTNTFGASSPGSSARRR